VVTAPSYSHLERHRGGRRGRAADERLDAGDGAGAERLFDGVGLRAAGARAGAGARIPATPRPEEAPGDVWL
jgi:hypothetical protein